MDDGRLDALGQTIVSALPGAAIEHRVAFNQLTVAVHTDKIVDVVRFLRDDPGCRFVSLIDVTAVDYPKREKRFDVVYHLLSPTLNARIRLRAEADETTQVPSIRRRGCFTNPSVSIRNSVTSISSRHGKARTIRCCPETRREAANSEWR